MKNDIKESLVSPIVAKMLKNAGFDVDCDMMYGSQNTPQLEKFNETAFKLYDDYYLAPTQQIAIDWIRTNFDIHVEYAMDIPQEGELDGCYVYVGNVKWIDNYKTKLSFTSNYMPSPEKAKDEALIYALNNL